MTTAAQKAAEEAILEKLPRFRVYLTQNPIEADEIVWVTYDPERAEAILEQCASPYKTDKAVYIAAPTQELSAFFESHSNAEFKALNFSKLKEFSMRNCGIGGVSMIAQFRLG